MSEDFEELAVSGGELREAWRRLVDLMRANRTRVLAHLAMLFVTCTFSLWNVLGELVLKRGIDPIVLATYRELGTAMLLAIGSVALHRGSSPKRPNLRQSALLVACGVGGVYGLQLFYVLGLARTDADTAALFQPLVPVLVLLLSALLGIERLRLCPWGEAVVRRSWQKLVGVVLACGGCLIVVRAGSGGGGDDAGGGGSGGDMTSGRRQLGLAFLLVSDLGAATFIVSQKPLLALYSPLLVIAASYTLGAAAMATTAAVLLGGGPLSNWAISPLEGGVLAFVIAVCGALDYALMTWANSRLEGVVIGIYGVVQPFATALLAYVIEGETVALLDILGGALILSGLVATSLAQEPGTLPAPSTTDADAVSCTQTTCAPALATPLLDASCEGGGS